MQSDVSSLPPPEAIHDALQPVVLTQPFVEPGVAILLILILIAAIILLKRLRRGPAFGSPEGRARMRLSMLRPDELPMRELFTELRAILADYLTARAGVAAAKQTSPEILTALEEAGFTGLLKDLEQFLSTSDRVRFSRSGTAPLVGRAAVDQCRRIIEQVHDAAI